MDDVLRHLVIAIGNKDLLANDAVMIAIRFRPGLQGTEIGAGLRLSEIHRAGPTPGDQRRQIFRFLGRAAMDLQRFDGPLRQQRTEREGHVGGIPDFLQGRGQGPGHTLAAISRIEGDRVPAGLGELPIGLGDTSRHHDLAINQANTFLVTDGIEWRQHDRSKFGGLFQNRIAGLGAGLFIAGQLGDRFQPGNMLKGKANIGERCGIGWHCRHPQSTAPPMMRRQSQDA